MSAVRHFDAAVLDEAAANAADAARAVPPDARMLTFGACTLGYQRAAPSAGSIRPTRWTIDASRLSEIWRVLERVPGPRTPQSHAAIAVVRLFHALAQWRARSPAAARIPAIEHCVWMLGEWRSPLDGAAVERAARAAVERKCPPSAVEVGNALGLTAVARKLLKIRTIRASGSTDAAVLKAAREGDAARKAEQRQKDGAMTRAEYVANSIAEAARREGVSRQTLYARQKRAMTQAVTQPPPRPTAAPPWVVAGVSRATWFRRRKMERSTAENETETPTGLLVRPE